MIGSSWMRKFQSGVTKIAVTSRIGRPDLVQGVDDHARILAASPGGRRHPPWPGLCRGRRRGLPFLTVAPRPGSQPRSSRHPRPDRARCPAPPAVRRLAEAGAWPIDPLVAGLVLVRSARSSRPSSHAVPAVRAPVTAQAVAEVAVVGDDEDRGGPQRSVDRARLVDQREEDGIGGPAAAVADAQARRRSVRRAGRVRRVRRRRHRWRSRSGTAPRSRPMSAPSAARRPSISRARAAGWCRR